MRRAVLAAVVLSVAAFSSGSAQSADGTWKIKFGKWINEDHPNANMQFVPTANLALRLWATP